MANRRSDDQECEHILRIPGQPARRGTNSTLAKVTDGEE